MSSLMSMVRRGLAGSSYRTPAPDCVAILTDEEFPRYETGFGPNKAWDVLRTLDGSLVVRWSDLSAGGMRVEIEMDGELLGAGIVEDYDSPVSQPKADRVGVEDSFVEWQSVVFEQEAARESAEG